jgi:hypothetical protein
MIRQKSRRAYCLRCVNWCINRVLTSGPLAITNRIIWQILLISFGPTAVLVGRESNRAERRSVLDNSSPAWGK